MQYKESHPWLTFGLRLKDLDADTWRLLGEAESKIEHIAGAPLPPQVAEHLYEIYLSKGAHATTQIEGNTLSQEDVLLRVQHQLKLPPSQEYLGQEIDNIVLGCNLVVRDVEEGNSLDLTPARIARFNEIVLRDLPAAPEIEPGRIRTHSVLVGGIYRGAPAQDCAYLLDRLCTWLNAMTDDAPVELRPSVSILSAIVAHLYLAWIHPFGDGNGRMARLVEFQLMARAGIPVAAAHLLSDHYNRTRSRYYQVLAESSRPPYPVPAFIKYAVEGFVDGLREQITVIRRAQFQIVWINLIHERIGSGTRESPIAGRQRRLMMDLPLGKITPLVEIRDLSPQLARMYGERTAKAVSRDVNKLVELGLVSRTRQGVRPYVEQIESFLPARARQDTSQPAK